MMYHLIPLPFIFLAVIVCIVSTHFGLKILKTVSKAIIVIGVLIFIYAYLDYKDFYIINYIKDFVSGIIDFLK